jgi:hypothetical protein
LTSEPHLGLATNEAMLRELICRFKMDTYADPASVSCYGSIERALALAEMLGGMSAPEREYRTVDAR